MLCADKKVARPLSFPGDGGSAASLSCAASWPSCYKGLAAAVVLSTGPLLLLTHRKAQWPQRVQETEEGCLASVSGHTLPVLGWRGGGSLQPLADVTP